MLFQSIDNELFKRLIEIEFKPDLEFITESKKTHLPDETNIALEVLAEKYANGCPSSLYSNVSEYLKQEYNFIHKIMCLQLYN